MLAVTANWEITDGSLVPSRAAAADAWLGVIQRAAIRAGWSRAGRYQPVTEVCLVFAGDTFNWLATDIWAGRDRPWHGGRNGQDARMRAALAGLQASRLVVRTLRRWMGNGMPVPAAGLHGRPSARGMQTAALSVFMLAGDRDGWMSQLGVVAARLGIHAGEEWSDGAFMLRHGHDLDPTCHGSAAIELSTPGDRPPTLSESIMVELVVPFLVTLRSDPRAWHAARPKLARLVNTPLLGLPAAVADMLADVGLESGVGRVLHRLWHQAVGTWFTAARREMPIWGTEHDVLDGVAAWLDAGVMGSERVSLPMLVASLGTRSPLRRLATASVVLGHVASSAGVTGLGGAAMPELVVLRREGGLGWREHLGTPPVGAGIVAVGGMAGGNGCVDAA